MLFYILVISQHVSIPLSHLLFFGYRERSPCTYNRSFKVIMCIILITEFMLLFFHPIVLLWVCLVFAETLLGSTKNIHWSVTPKLMVTNGIPWYHVQLVVGASRLTFYDSLDCKFGGETGEGLTTNHRPNCWCLLPFHPNRTPSRTEHKMLVAVPVVQVSTWKAHN